MMMQNRRALSNLVATVLIVLLALAAVAIVWGFLRPAFTDAGTEVGLQSQCFTAEVEAITCTATNADPNAPEDVTVRGVARLKNGDVSGIRYIIDDINGGTQYNEDVSPVEPLDAEDVSGTVDITSLVVDGTLDNVDDYTDADDNPLLAKLTVAPLVSDDEGNEEACTPTSIPCSFTADCASFALNLCDSSECGTLNGHDWCDPDAIPASGDEYCKLDTDPCV